MAWLSDSDDYVWHFKFGDVELPGGEGDALAEMVRSQLAALLRCVTFTSGGKDVPVTGFRFLAQRETEHLIAPPHEADEAPGAD